MKISLISTVLNEEKNIRTFLDSIINQSKKPNEFIIVDGGSKDKTFDILKEYSKKHRWIKVYLLEGANIAKGRNYAIRKSKGEIIFTSDSSTVFEKDWIKKILKSFKKDVDVIFGIYYAKPKGIIERFLISRLPNWKKIDPNKFLPSNRHTAFRRKVWKEIGGFPEHLKRADDNWFHSEAHKRGFNYLFVKDVKVQWLFDRNLKKMLKLAFLDSKTEGFSFMFIEKKIYIAEILLFFFGLALVLLGICLDLKILIYSIILGGIFSIIIGGYLPYKKTKDAMLLFIGPFLIILLYFAHVFGVLTGVFQRAYKKNEGGL